MVTRYINISAKNMLKANGASVFGIWKTTPKKKHQVNTSSTPDDVLELPEFLVRIQEERKLR